MKDSRISLQIAAPLKKRVLPLYSSRSKSTLFSIFVFVVCAFLLFPSRAGATPLYSCGDPTVNHCYGYVDWPGNVIGSATSIFTNQMHSGDAFVDNEMWLSYQNYPVSYWVEVGTIADLSVSNGNEALFWADKRPGNTLAYHPGPQLSPSDFGKSGFFAITKDSSSTFSVYAGNLPVAGINAESISNAINPNDINIGMELGGSSGATSPVNGYTNNEYKNGSGWHYQPNSGLVTHLPSTSPVRTRWNPAPASNGSNFGGEFDTCFNSNCF